MGDLHHVDYQNLVLDRVDDPAGSLPDTVLLLAGQLLSASWTRILGQGADPCDGPLALLLLRDGLDLSYCRRLDANAISCHCA